jgi:chlorobactene glucosyltransferase
MLRDWYLVALVCVNAYFLATALSNIAYFRLATRKPRVTGGSRVSVIIPARDEERSIGPCLRSLLAQDYADYEIVVVDDCSSDATARVVTESAAGDPRVRLVTGVPLPEGWLGKTHALCQGVAASDGEILILTDADTVHETQSISWAVTNLVDHRADMLSGYVAQRYGTFGERIVVPTMYAMMLLVPLSLVARTRSPRFAFAIGQFVALRREALEGIGGFEAIRDSIVDDMAMAIRMKECGYREVFLDAKAAAGCRLYSGYRDAFVGIERSIYSAVGGRPVTAAAMAAVVLGLIVGPAFALPMSYARLELPPGALALSVALFAVQWAFVAWDRDMPLVAVVLYPLVFLNLVIILASSMVRTGFGRGVDWKGRLVRVPRPSAASRAARVADLADRSGKVR